MQHFDQLFIAYVNYVTPYQVYFIIMTIKILYSERCWGLKSETENESLENDDTAPEGF